MQCYPDTQNQQQRDFGEVQVVGCGSDAEEEKIFWSGRVKRRDVDDQLTYIQEVVVPGRRPRGRPRKNWHDCVHQDFSGAGVSEDLAANRDEWRAVVNRLTSSNEGRRRR